MSQSPNPLVSTTDLSESERHLLLSAERRRTALAVLRDRDPPIDLDELAAAVARREGGEVVAEERIDRTRIALHHSHLPHMADLGVIDYDRDARRIA